MFKNINENSLKSIKNIFWMLLDKVIKFGLSLLVTVIVANYYGSQGYGTYQYAISIVAIFELITFLIDSTVVKKFYIQFPEEEVVVASTVARFSCAALAALLGLIYLIILNNDIEFNYIFIILLLNSVVGSLQFGMTNRFEFLLKSKNIVFASNISSVIAFVLQIFAVYLKLSIIAIAFISLISTTTTMLITCFLYHKEYGKVFQARIHIKLLKAIIKDSFPFALAAACITIYSKCDTIMIGNMLSKGDVGIYAIAIKIVSVVQIAIIPVTESVYPHLLRLHEEDQNKYQHYFIRVTSMLTWLYIVGVSISFFVLPLFFRFLSDEYAKAFDVYKVYVLGTFFAYNSAFRSCHYAMTNMGKIVVISQLVSVIINICMNYFGIKYIGLLGAAWATVVTQFVSLIIINCFFEEGRKLLLWQLSSLNPIRMVQ